MNEDKFTGRAETYEKYRPGYPDSLIDCLYTELGFRCDSVIADIGAGTGIFTEYLLRRGSAVYGVEPNGDMRRTAEERLSAYEKYHSVGASAEHTGLDEASVDHIAAAQAFHWFDRDQFRAECRRILKPGGTVALIWNSRDTESPLVRENDAINRKYCARYKGFSGGVRTEDTEQFADFFRDGAYRSRIFRYDLIFDKEGFIGRNLSGSYAPLPEEEAYTPYVRELGRLFEKYEAGGLIRMPNTTRCYAGKV